MCDLIPGAKVKIDNDMWQDAGVEYTIKEISFRPNSTAVLVTLADENGREEFRVLPRHQLYTDF